MTIELAVFFTAIGGALVGVPVAQIIIAYLRCRKETK